MATNSLSGLLSSSGKPKPPKVKQACDCCHARKIRCDGAQVQPCNNCQIADLSCTYHAVPKKKGPKGPSRKTPRAILKMQLQLRQESPKPSEPSPVSVPALSLSNASSSPSDFNYMPEPVEPVFIPSPFLTFEVATHYVEVFFKYKYAVTPCLHRGRLFAQLESFQSSPNAYALIASLCACMIGQLQIPQQPLTALDISFDVSASKVDFFISEAKRARLFRDHMENPTISDVHTSFFLFSTMFNYNRHNSAWFYLREAMTMSQVLKLEHEETYLSMDKVDEVFSRRTFWLLFVSERAYALQKHRPLSLQSSIELPTVSPDDPDAGILRGFLDLVFLFQHFDDKFIALWNSQDLSLPHSSTEAAPALATQFAALQSILSMSIPDLSKHSEIQQSDLVITRQWLKTMVWQLCVTKGLLSSSSTDASMGFYYPISIAKDVASSITVLKKESFEPHGPGILEKVFDMGCSLVDVLQLHPPSTMVMASSMEVGPRDYLMEMIKLCSTVLHGSTKYLPLLAAKAEECLRVGLSPQINVSESRVFELDEGDPTADQYGEPMITDPAFSGTPITDYSGTPSSSLDLGLLQEFAGPWLGSISDHYVDYVD